jgi:tetratricopeptide (TPR) repeat protein
MPEADALPQDSEHNRLYKRGVALVYEHLPLHGQPAPRPGFMLRRRLRKGIALLQRVVEIKPSNWAAMWMIGMTYRRLGDHASSLAWLKRACEFSGPNPDVPREAGLSAMNLGRYDDAIEYTNRAIRLNPSDAGLVANLALAHLFNQNIPEAKRAADHAVGAAPEDPINHHVLAAVEAVLEGKLPCPRNERELQQSFQRRR